MKKFRLAYESEHLIASAVINATSRAYAEVLFKEKLKELHPELSNRIDPYNIFSTSNQYEGLCHRDGNIEELVTRT